MTTVSVFARSSLWDCCASIRLHKAEAHGAADARLAAHSPLRTVLENTANACQVAPLGQAELLKAEAAALLHW